MANCSNTTTSDGLRAIELHNAQASVSILPQAGGRIAGLADRRCGRNWLWRNPYLPSVIPRFGADYGSVLDAGGWDEILPSVRACTLALADGTHINLPDHGELVGQQWELLSAETDANGRAVCAMACNGRALPYRFERTVVLDATGARLRIDYRLENTGAFAWPWLWSAHPLIAIEPGMRIHVADAPVMRMESLHGAELAAQAPALHWPLLPLAGREPLDLSRIFCKQAQAPPLATKVFLQSKSAHGVSVTSADGRDRLRMRYDCSPLPWLGLWINNRGWSGSGSPPYLNLGIEPCTTPFDSLTEARQHAMEAQIQPAEVRAWSIEVVLEHGSEAAHDS